MKTSKLLLLGGLFWGLISSHASTVVVSDNFNVTGSGSGFNLGSGINSGINPPTTRLSGVAASGLRYINTGTKATTAYTINGNKLRVSSAANPGRFVLSADGSTPFDFGPLLGVDAASPSNPIVYDLVISMDNDSSGTQRFSFAIGTAEGDANTWDFGVQVYRANSGHNYYTIGKRIDTKASGLGSDLNAPIHTMASGTYGTEIQILMRVTDAGAETSGYNSRVQLSLNGGSSWFYDTASDSDLSGTGWRFNGSGRVIMWDVAPNAGNVTYDNFSLTWQSGPRAWTGAGSDSQWSTGANWGGLAAPGNGDSLTFNGTVRQVNTNDISGLTVPWVTFNNGGFVLNGNELLVTSSITNLGGNNIFKANLTWDTDGTKQWNAVPGSEIILDNTTSMEVGGALEINGGGTVRVTGSMNIGVATTANPPFIINEGQHVIDGGTFTSRGGYRIGSLATGPGAATIVSNGASFNLTVQAANLRVGNSSNSVTSKLLVHNSSVTLAGGHLGVSYAAGASGEVVQTGGIVSGAIVNFSQSGAGTGTYTITDGILEPKEIRKGNASGVGRIYFNNATLRPASGASSGFFSGLDLAEIQSGGLTIDGTSAVTIAQPLSGSGSLTKIGSAKVTLTGSNSYTGTTTISNGTLAIGSGGSIASSSIVIANGATFDVSAAGSFALASGQILARNALSGVGNVNGSLTLNSGAGLSFQVNGTNGNVGTLAISGNLTVNSNTVSVHVTGSALGIGVYPLASYTGSLSGLFNPVPVISGSGLETGLTSKIRAQSGVVELVVHVPRHGISAANIHVVQHDLANKTNSITLSMPFSINDFRLRAGSNRGDYNVQIGDSSNDDVDTGVLITSVAENGRDNREEAGVVHCTSGAHYNRSGANSGSFFIPIHSAPESKEYNINVAAALFPFTNWIAGHARNVDDINGGPNNLFTGSPGLTPDTHFIDHGDGTSTVDLRSLGINSMTDGVLMVTHARNEANFALSTANTNGTWTVIVRDNATNGSVYEQDPVGFVFIPKTNISVISGKFQGDGTPLIYSGDTPRFSVTNISQGTWRLTIPGYTPDRGVLLLSPDAASPAGDNMVSYQPDGNGWIIQTRDLPGKGLQALTGPVASFVFIPAPGAVVVSPQDNAQNISSSPTLTVSLTNTVPGNLQVAFHGRETPMPYPGPDFSIAVLPDTQNYARENSGYGQAIKEMWFAQTDWIIANRDTHNIAYVIHLGDIVHNGDIKNGNPNNAEWRIATNAMYRIESQVKTLRTFGIPYGLSVGNHDQEPIGDPFGASEKYNQYFGVSHFAGRDYYGGHFGSDNDNHFGLFTASGIDFIVIFFEFHRYGDAVINWANSVLATNQHRRAIVVTHHAGSDKTPSTFSTQGAALYNGLKHNTNFFMMLGGHVFSNGGEGSRSNTYNGNTVRTFISDYQNRMNGGNGWMRMMYFSPSNNTVTIKTYSPWLDQWETDANSQMSFNYPLQLPTGPGSPGTPYALIGTQGSVSPGGQASVTWSGRQTKKNYDWYVVVTNEAGDTFTSKSWRFKTANNFSRPAVADANFNGLPDDWEAFHRIDDPDGDNDGDGQSNRAEYIAKTDPNDASSVLRILSAEPVEGGFIKVTWSSVGGVRYRLQYSDGDLENFVDLPRDEISERDLNPDGEPSVQSYIDIFDESGVPESNVRFYRVRVVED